MNGRLVTCCLVILVSGCSPDAENPQKPDSAVRIIADESLVGIALEAYDDPKAGWLFLRTINNEQLVDGKVRPGMEISVPPMQEFERWRAKNPDLLDELLPSSIEISEEVSGLRLVGRVGSKTGDILAVGDALAVTREGEQTVVTITSERGIGSAELARQGGGWPQPIVIRLQLKGLEALELRTVTQGVRASVLSHSPSKQICESLIPGERNTKVLDEKAALWMPVRIVNPAGSGAKAIPLASGYFEARVPAALLDQESEKLTIRWIDFYR